MVQTYVRYKSNSECAQRCLFLGGINNNNIVLTVRILRITGGCTSNFLIKPYLRSQPQRLCRYIIFYFEKLSKICFFFTINIIILHPHASSSPRERRTTCVALVKPFVLNLHQHNNNIILLFYYDRKEE